MESFIPRMFHIDPARQAGLLLCLLLLLAMQVWAEDSNTLEISPPQTSAPAAPPVPNEPVPVIGDGPHSAEMERQITEQMARTIEQEIEKAFGNKHLAGLAVLIPLFAIFFIFGGPIILVIIMVVLHYRAKARRERQQSENIAQLLAAGKDVPLELLRADEASNEVAENNLRKGVKNIGLGAGLLLFLTLFMGIGIGAVGFIMIGLGISQLVIWKLADNKTAPHKLQD